jgi:hypothetical protein
MTTVLETRGARHYSLLRDYTYMSPTSFHQPIPDNVAIDNVEGPAAVAALAARAKQAQPRINCKQFSPTTFVVPADQPRVPLYVPSGWAPKRAIFQVYGVPVDVDAYLAIYEQKLALGDTDLSCVVTQPDYVSPDGLLFGREYGMWRLKPTTDTEQAATGCRLKFSDAGCYRITGLTTSVGYTVARPHVSGGKLVPLDQPGWKREWGPGYVYGQAPPDDRLDQLECWELQAGLQLMSASGLALGPMVIRGEDLDRGEIAHAMSFGIGAELVTKGVRWPAQASDGSQLGAVLKEGMRFQLDPAVDVDSLGMSPLGAMVARACQRFGFFLVDRSGTGSSFATSGEWGLGDRPDVAGVRRGAKGELLCFDGFPWAGLRLVAEGSPAVPIPTTGVS